ncbi:hypothetical protein [Bacillus pseudomycoides]|nr:hypothetical protein [Bacillus pseudomycoides]
MAKKGQIFQPYTEEFKRKAVMMYVIMEYISFYSNDDSCLWTAIYVQ